MDNGLKAPLEWEQTGWAAKAYPRGTYVIALNDDGTYTAAYATCVESRWRPKRVLGNAISTFDRARQLAERDYQEHA